VMLWRRMVAASSWIVVIVVPVVVGVVSPSRRSVVVVMVVVVVVVVSPPRRTMIVVMVVPFLISLPFNSVPDVRKLFSVLLDQSRQVKLVNIMAMSVLTPVSQATVLGATSRRRTDVRRHMTTLAVKVRAAVSVLLAAAATLALVQGLVPSATIHCAASRGVR